MTHKATLTQSGSTDKLTQSGRLASAIEAHCVKEKASFHTPGHKGGTNFRCGQNLWAMDVTELPGLDELAYASGVLASVQERAQEIWKTAASFISINGATAGLLAAVMAVRSRGSRIAVPRNAHRSVINALVISGFEPVWYEPEWDWEWQTWGALHSSGPTTGTAPATGHGPTIDSGLAAVMVVSPTYGGALSEIEALANRCKQAAVPLIVDEAHGAHAPHAVAAGADIVVHSLHKTLSAMTQTGVVHVTHGSLVDPTVVRLALNMVQSSSPNYVLMGSIEQALGEVADGSRIKAAIDLSNKARAELGEVSNHIHLYEAPSQDPLHMLIRHDSFDAPTLYDHLATHGVFAEAIVGKGVLLLFGAGSSSNDVNALIAAIRAIDVIGTNDELDRSLRADASAYKPVFGDQVISPQQAFFAPTESVSAKDAVGRICAECVAPCPPGTPVLVPGQRIPAQSIQLCKLPEIRVVVESQQGER